MAQVLLIEPNRVLGQTYHRALTSAGHHVHTCATAQSAILSADEICPDIVVLELQLVAHSGVEFLYEFRSYADWQAVPIIVHSHVPAAFFGSTNSTSVAKQLGIAEYFYKPNTSLQTLLKAIDEHSLQPK